MTFSLFIKETNGADVPNWNKDGLIKNPFSEPIGEEKATTQYFQYYILEEDWPKPFPAFMSRVIEVGKEPECRRIKSSNREPLNWLPKLSYFENDFFLAAVGLFILEKFSNDTSRSSRCPFSPWVLPNFLYLFADQACTMLTHIKTKDATS